jgi:hypothetical protein
MACDIDDREGESPSPMEPRLGRMSHSSATGRRREQTLPEALGLRQALHPRDDTAGSAGGEARTTRSAVAHRPSIASQARMRDPNRRLLSDRSHHCHHGGRSGWRSSYAACASAACSSRRELMSSLVKILRRCHSTVRADRNSWAPISGLVRPSRASRAMKAIPPALRMPISAYDGAHGTSSDDVGRLQRDRRAAAPGDPGTAAGG